MKEEKMKHKAKRFDLRKVDYDTGKRLPLSSSERIKCECCGRKIVKGWILNTGEKVGSQCACVGEQLRYRKITKKLLSFMGYSEKQARFFGFTIES
jgi:hypothetical protein